MSAEFEAFRRERVDILKTLDLVIEIQGKSELSQLEVIAFGTLLQNVYTGIESLIRLETEWKQVRFKKSEGWHKFLLDRAHADGVFADSEYEILTELLKFRHMHVHGYAHRLKESRLRELAEQTVPLTRKFLTTMEDRFREIEASGKYERKKPSR